MIESKIIPDYEKRNIPIIYTPANLKYLYPQRYGYRKTAQAYTIPVPLYTEPRSYATGLEGILYQRQEVIDARIKMILSEIDQRRILKEENIHQIGLSQCTCRGMIYELKQRYLDRRVVDLEKKMIDLEQEKRQEQTGYFRDILFLRKELRETIVEKLEEEQKAEFFGSPLEGALW